MMKWFKTLTQHNPSRRLTRLAGAVLVGLALVQVIPTASKSVTADGTPMNTITIMDPTDKDASFYQEYPNSRFNLLGAAQNFHVLTHTLYDNTGMSGNVAASSVDLSNMNFQTPGKGGTIADLETDSGQTKDTIPYYLQGVTHIPTGAFSEDTNVAGGVRLIFGSDVPLGIGSDNRIQIIGDNGNQEIEKPQSVYRDRDSAQHPYIDFTYEFNRLLRLSQVFAESGAKEDKGQSAGVTVTKAGMGNNLTYDVSKAAVTYPMRVTKLATNVTLGQTVALPNVEFTVGRKTAAGYEPVMEDGKPVTVTTGDDGGARYAATSPGDYAFQEVQAPDGYVTDKTWYPVHVANRDATYIKMDAATDMGTAPTSSASTIVIKGIDTTNSDPKDTDSNPGPIIINVDCHDYDITKPPDLNLKCNT